MIRQDWIDNSPEGSLKVPEGARPWKTHDDMKDGKNWLSILRSVSKVNEQPEFPEITVPERTCDNYYEENPEVPTCQAVANYLPTMNPVVGRYVEQKHISGKEPPPTPEEIAAKAERMRRLAAREKESGIIVHVMSKYMGMRVHVMDTSEQKCAALMSELFAHHFKTQDLWEGFKDKFLAAFEEKFLQGWEKITEGLNEVLAYADGSALRKIGDGKITVRIWVDQYMSHEGLKKCAKDVKNHHMEAKRTAGLVIDEYFECVEDRQRFRCHIHDSVYYVWQSLCTTILSRRLRTEEDIDDGTYTTVEKIQFANEFKRLGILSEEVRDEQVRRIGGRRRKTNPKEGRRTPCLNVIIYPLTLILTHHPQPITRGDPSQCSEMKRILKTRIRDLKRIFQFYAAAGDGGPADSMDHSEFWKFVKDCKLQKDRKAMPSVRVDLIFQCCNIDYSLEGKDRLQSDDGELEPTEFVESLARLAVYRFTKGTPAQRLQKLLDEEVLPNACSVDTDVFRERIAGDRVKDVFAKHKHNMKIIYKVFAADDDDGDAAMFNDTMNNKELVSFCRDFKMIGPLMSERSVKVLFAYVQQEEEALDEDERSEDVGDSEMVFAEFVEANAAMGCQMRPDPYNVVEIRIDHFISQEIIPRAHEMTTRFRGKGLRKLEKPEGATGE